MRKLKLLIVTATIALLSGCSGSDNTLIVDPSVPDNGLPGSRDRIADTSDVKRVDPLRRLGDRRRLQRLVRDASNNVMEGIAVAFSADTGSLTVTQPADHGRHRNANRSTDTRAEILTNRTITVTATVTSYDGPDYLKHHGRRNRHAGHNFRLGVVCPSAKRAPLSSNS